MVRVTPSCDTLSIALPRIGTLTPFVTRLLL